MSPHYTVTSSSPLTLLLALILVTGCTATQHRKKVDNNVYAILAKAEKEVFKKNSQFTIDTPTSHEPLENINNANILKRSSKKGTLKLNISESLQYAVKHSREYQSQKEALYLVALGLSDAQIPFDINAASSADVNTQRSSDGERTLGANATNSLATLLKGGGNLSLSLANDLLQFFTGNTDRSINSLITFNLTQPLLRGRGAEIAAESLTQSYRNVIYEIRSYATFQRNFYREIVIDYLRLLQLQEQVENELVNFRSRQENFEYLEARSIDRASPEEVADAQQEVLEAETRHINAQSDYATALDIFKISIGMPAGMTLELEPKELEKIVEKGPIPLDFTQESAYQTALQYRSSLLNAVDIFEDSRRQVLIAADELKTNLNFVSDASINSSGNRWERLNFNDISANIGLELDLPVNRKRERNDYRRSLIDFDAEARSLSLTHDQLRNLIKLRYREIEQFRKNYDIQVGAVKLAERRVEGNRLRLKAGTLIFRRLSESQDSLINAQNAVTSALVNYQESRLTLYEDLDTLDINTPNFWLK